MKECSGFNLGQIATKEYFDYEVDDVKYPEGSVVAIFDMDTVVFPVVSVCDKTSVVVKNSKGQTKEFKNRTKFKEWCKQRGKNSEDYSIKDKVVPEPLSHCLNSIKVSTERLAKEVGATHCEYYLGGSGNFRMGLPLPVRYKGTRASQRKPTHLKDAQNYVVNKLGAKKIKGIECDDFVSIRTIEVNKQKGVKGVLITSDKDALQTFSSLAYVYRQGVEYKLDNPLGKLWIQPNGDVKGTGLKFLLMQCLCIGDPTDGYIPTCFFDRKYGQKTYYKLVNDIDNVKELLTVVITKWKRLVGDSVTYMTWDDELVTKGWLELAELYWNCAFMSTERGKRMTFEDVLKYYGVSYK